MPYFSGTSGFWLLSQHAGTLNTINSPVIRRHWWCFLGPGLPLSSTIMARFRAFWKLSLGSLSTTSTAALPKPLRELRAITDEGCRGHKPYMHDPVRGWWHRYGWRRVGIRKAPYRQGLPRASGHPLHFLCGTTPELVAGMDFSLPTPSTKAFDETTLSIIILQTASCGVLQCEFVLGSYTPWPKVFTSILSLPLQKDVSVLA